MDFRTEFLTYEPIFSINHRDNILFLGSCFTENIGKKMQKAKFNVSINPLGIAFNPVSLHKQLIFSDSKAKELIVSKNNGIHFHPDFHSKFNSLSKENYQEKLNSGLEIQTNQLTKGNTIFLTYGTAWVYESISEKNIVNNCHKLPSKNFKKRLLTVLEIVNSFKSCAKELSKRYSKSFRFVFTVSPVRHLKDGFHENQLSKSTLMLAVKSIYEQFPNCHYFPAFEIIMDDLRDYRFYDEDLIHPNAKAIEYIWEKFQLSFFAQDTIKLIEETAKIRRSIEHRPFNEKSEAHQHFLVQLLKKVQLFAESNELDFQKEIQLINQQL